MKRSFVRIATIASLMMAMALGALPLQAQSRERDRDRDDCYRTRDDSYRDRDDSYRDRDDDSYRPRPRQAYYSEPYSQPYQDSRYYGQPRYQQHRSVGKSALIVGGSAAAGAGIGALAGGGKGAGIGAIAGGLGGFIYDRLTANHHH